VVIPEPEAAATEVAKLVKSARMAVLRMIAAIVTIDDSGKEVHKEL